MSPRFCFNNDDLILSEVKLSLNCISIIVPPLKSIPRFKPFENKEKIETNIKISDKQ